MKIEQKDGSIHIRPEAEEERQAVELFRNCPLGYSMEHDKEKEQQ